LSHERDDAAAVRATMALLHGVGGGEVYAHVVSYFCHSGIRCRRSTARREVDALQERVVDRAKRRRCIVKLDVLDVVKFEIVNGLC
jgi:hypothetical protein